MEALIRVDIQNDFCPGGSLAVPGGDEVVEPLNRISKWADKQGYVVISTADWHPPRTSHFKDFGGIWPVHCVQGTRGADFHPSLRFPQYGRVFQKGTRPGEDGYSGYTDSVRSLLKALGVTTIYVGGLATDFCVKVTVLDALADGLKVYVLTDACRAVNTKPGDGDVALDEMKTAGAVLTTTEAVIAETVTSLGSSSRKATTNRGR